MIVFFRSLLRSIRMSNVKIVFFIFFKGSGEFFTINNGLK